MIERTRQQRRSRLPLLALIGANLVSTIGGSMSLVALPWFAFQVTGDPALTGIVAAAEFLPVMLASLVSGAIVARLGARGTRVVSDLVSGVAVLAIPILYAATGLPYPALLILVAVNGFLRTPAVSASFVMLRRTAEAARTTTDAVSGPYLSSLRLAGVIGAPVAGATISWLGAPTVLVIDAATFLISGIAVQLLLPAGADDDNSGDDRPSMRTAWAVLRSDRVLIRLIMTAVLLSFIGSAWGSVLAPIYGQTVLHSSTALGVIIAGNGIGSIIGTGVAGPIAARVNRRLLLPACVAVQVVPLFGALAVRAPAPTLTMIMVVAGIAGGLLGANFTMIEYDRVPARQQAHVFGLSGGLGQVGMTLGPVLVGAMIGGVPMAAVLIVIMIIGILAAANLALTSGLGTRSNATV